MPRMRWIRKKISIDLNPSRSLKKDRLVPMEEYETLPSYYIYGGLIFCPLSKNLLDIWGSQRYQSAPKEYASGDFGNLSDSF